jgi:hypothetical protein
VRSRLKGSFIMVSQCRVRGIASTNSGISTLKGIPFSPTQ